MMWRNSTLTILAGTSHPDEADQPIAQQKHACGAPLASANFIIHTYPKAVVGTAIVHYTARSKN